MSVVIRGTTEHQGRGCREVLIVGQDRPELFSWAGVRPSLPEYKEEHLNGQAMALSSPLLILIRLHYVTQAALKLATLLFLLFLCWF